MSSLQSVSLREIAAKAGVSAMSVSRALRNDRKVSPTEAERIRAIATEMGYSRNPFLSTWMRHMRRQRRVHEREVVALVAFQAETLRALWFKAIKEGAERFAEPNGYRVDAFLAEGSENSAALFRILRNRGIRGVILAPLLDTDFPEEAWQHSVAAISHPHDVKKIDIVDTDHYDGMVLALSRLTKLGFKRIAYWSSTLNVESHKRWEAAFRLFQLDLPLPNRLPVLALNAGGENLDYAGWVRAHRPDVIICPNNHIYLGLQKAAPSILRHTSWVTLNREGSTKIAGIDIHLEMLGEAAARVVTRKMELNEIGPPNLPRSVFIRPDWFEGETLRPIVKNKVRSRARSTTR